MNVQVSYFLMLISIIGYSKVESLSKIRNARQSHTYDELSEHETNLLALKSNLDEFNRVLNKVLVPRVVGTPQHKKVANFIAKEMSSLGWHVERDQFRDVTPTFGELQFENIIAKLNPNADRFLVLACHYDSKYMREYNFVGATDSAVPCSMMLNLAKVMQNELESVKDKEDVSLAFVFFDGEEAFRTWSPTDSIYGARNLAAKWENLKYVTKENEITNHLQRIDILVLLDLIGEPNPKFYSYFADTHPWYKRLVDIEGRLAEMGRLRNHDSRYFEPFNVGAHIEDDHLPFMKRGTPILHIIPTPFPQNWHKPSDNRSALDIDTIDNLNKIFRVFVAEYLHIKM